MSRCRCRKRALEIAKEPHKRTLFSRRVPLTIPAYMREAAPGLQRVYGIAFLDREFFCREFFSTLDPKLSWEPYTLDPKLNPKPETCSASTGSRSLTGRNSRNTRSGWKMPSSVTIAPSGETRSVTISYIRAPAPGQSLSVSQVHLLREHRAIGRDQVSYYQLHRVRPGPRPIPPHTRKHTIDLR